MFNVKSNLAPKSIKNIFSSKRLPCSLRKSTVIQCRSTKPILYGLESIISLELKIRAFPGPGYLRSEDGVV